MVEVIGMTESSETATHTTEPLAISATQRKAQRESTTTRKFLTNATESITVECMGRKKKTEMDARDKKAMRLWLNGLTYAEIGSELGFSRQRAQQIIRRSTNDYPETKRSSKAARRLGL